MQYDIILKGTVDNSPDTLRSVKRILISDLNDIDRVREIFTNLPATIKSAKSQTELIPFLEALQNAGAQVSIAAVEAEAGLLNLQTKNYKTNTDSEEKQAEEKHVLTHSEAKEEEQEGSSGYGDFEQEEADEDQDEGEVFLIDFEFEEESNSAPKKTHAPGTVYSLDDFQEEDPEVDAADKTVSSEVDRLVSELEVSTQVSKAEHPSLEEIVKPHIPRHLRQFDDQNQSVNPEDKQEAESSVNPPATSSTEQVRTESEPTKLKEKDLKNRIISIINRSKDVILSIKLKRIIPNLKKYLRKHAVVRDTFATLMASAIILIGAVVVIKQIFSEKPQFSVSKPEQSGSEQQDSANNSLAPKKQKKEINLFRAESKTPEREIVSEFEVKKDKLESLSIVVTTPKPPKLTDEDIIENKVRAPWVEKVVVHGLAVKNKDNCEFLAFGAAKIFIDYKKIKKRYTGNAAISGQYNKDNQNIQAKILINMGYTDLPKDVSFKFVRQGKGKYNFFLSEEIEARQAGN
jgi:hypothetical protein